MAAERLSGKIRAIGRISRLSQRQSRTDTDFEEYEVDRGLTERRRRRPAREAVAQPIPPESGPSLANRQGSFRSQNSEPLHTTYSFSSTNSGSQPQWPNSTASWSQGPTRQSSGTSYSNSLAQGQGSPSSVTDSSSAGENSWYYGNRSTVQTSPLGLSPQTYQQPYAGLPSNIPAPRQQYYPAYDVPQMHQYQQRLPPGQHFVLPQPALPYTSGQQHASQPIPPNWNTAHLNQFQQAASLTGNDRGNLMNTSAEEPMIASQTPQISSGHTGVAGHFSNLLPTDTPHQAPIAPREWLCTHGQRVSHE
ncbi:MAG: hypothetical protein M1820_004123 [Bogoriella megaspora]|nr:MAG: hypothetical protein M1820_004123 [Bogoriella megaspora]